MDMFLTAMALRQICVDEQLLPAVQLGAPLVDSLTTAHLSEPAKRALKQTHRRSHSFSALEPPSRSFPDFFPTPRESSGSYSSQYTEYNDQPWRSHDVWKALHSPATSLSPASGHRIPLTHPVMLNGTGGWKSGNAEGLFSGRQTPQPRKLGVPSPHGFIPVEQGGSDHGWEEHPSDPDDQGRHAELQPPFRMDLSTPRQPKAQTSPRLPRRSVSWKSPIRNSDTYGQADTSPSRYCHGDSLLPPLMPRENVQTPQRSSSLAAAHAKRNSAVQPVSRSTTNGAHKPGPVTWGRHLSFDRHPSMRDDSAPERPPKSERRRAELQLSVRAESPARIHDEDAQSGELSFESSPPSWPGGEDERSYEEDETSHEGSSTMSREHLATPATTPSAFCHDTSGSPGRSDNWQGKCVSPVEKPWSVAGRRYRTNVTRGGWI